MNNLNASKFKKARNNTLFWKRYIINLFLLFYKIGDRYRSSTQRILSLDQGIKRLDMRILIRCLFSQLSGTIEIKEQTGNQTRVPFISSQMLFQLSYLAPVSNRSDRHTPSPSFLWFSWFLHSKITSGSFPKQELTS